MLDKEFINKIEEIWLYITKYGAYKSALYTKETSVFDYPIFYKYVNEGFKIGQKLILDELLSLNDHQITIEFVIKQAKEQREATENIKKYTLYLGVLKYKERILRNLAYTIAWQIVNGKREQLARLYTGESGNKDLSGSDFNETINQVNEINKDPNSFALILDLTENLQIGDLLVDNIDKDPFLVEVKSGLKNQEARDIIEERKRAGEELSKEVLNIKYDPNFVKQILRMHKQDVKQARYEEIINTDIGTDPKNEDLKVIQIEPTTKNEKFHNEIIKGLESVDDIYNKEIEGCVNIGIYRGDARINAKESLKNLNNDFPIVCLTDSIGLPIVEPLFVKEQYGWNPKDILSIIKRDILVYIGIDLEKYIELGKQKGLNIYWSSRKEKAKLFEEFKSKGVNTKELLTHDNKCIVIEDENLKLKGCLGWGQLVRIMFDQYLPSSVLENRKEGFGNIKEQFSDRS